MKYDFSHLSFNFEDFIDSYTSCVTTHNDDITATALGIYEEIFSLLKRSFDEEEITVIYEKLSEHRMGNNIPYAIVANEVHSLKHMLISSNEQYIHKSDIFTLLHLFESINNCIASIYLLNYTKALVALNTIRIHSIEDLVEKNIMLHYEAHLIWLSDLAIHIEDKNKRDFPEVNHTLCKFGCWLHSEAKEVIPNKKKYESLVRLHSNLHLFASKIYKILGKGNYHILITYLEKCEFISLGIGTELALLDQILINKKISQDPLTGALNRNGLSNIFTNQYELALATGNSFVIAMCDLDYFKNINDTYGHVAGDQLLKLFVNVVKKTLRNSDIIIRYGGEEFLMILPSITKTKAIDVLETIRQDFASSLLEFNDESITDTVSIGMLEIHPEELFNEKFIHKYLIQVDENLYLAKERGRNRIEF